MIRKQIQILIFTLLLITPTLPSFAQKSIKKALGKPKLFERPIDNNALHLYQPQRWERSKLPWMVMCDRHGIQTYSKPENKGTALKKLRFKDWFYIAEEAGEWVRIFKGKVEPITLKVEGFTEDFGWIHKQDILLWNEALMDSKTKHTLKTLLFPKISSIQHFNKTNFEIAIYKRPETDERVKKSIPNDLFYILKKENSRLLISYVSRFNPQFNKEEIIGWIRMNEVEQINTNLWFEPNFEPQAIEERQQNKKFKVIGYGNEIAARRQTNGEAIDEKNIFWEENYERMPLNQMRFPLLSIIRSDSPFIRTGWIGFLSDSTAETTSQNGFFSYNLTRELRYNLGDSSSNTLPYQAFYTELFFSKKIEKARHQNFQLVLLLTRTELMKYISQLDKLILKSHNAPLSEVREEMNITLRQLCELFTNEISENTSLGEIFDAQAQGLVNFEKWHYWKISDFTIPRNVSDNDIEKIIGDLRKQLKKLKAQFEKMPPFKFSETSPNTYYWIPVNYLF